MKKFIVSSPEPIRQLWVDEVMPNTREISFWAVDDMIQPLKQYGHVMIVPGGQMYNIIVSNFYDFEEVVEYFYFLQGDTDE